MYDYIACMYVCMCTICLSDTHYGSRRAGSLGTGVKEVRERPCGYWKSSPGPLPKRQVLWTTELCLQHQAPFTEWCDVLIKKYTLTFMYLVLGQYLVFQVWHRRFPLRQHCIELNPGRTSGTWYQGYEAQMPLDSEDSELWTRPLPPKH